MWPRNTMRRRHRNTLEPIFRHPVTGNIPRWQTKALLMTITVHGGKVASSRPHPFDKLWRDVKALLGAAR